MIGIGPNTKIDPDAVGNRAASLEVFSQGRAIAVKISDPSSGRSMGVSFSSPETVQHIIDLLQRTMTEVFGRSPPKPG